MNPALEKRLKRQVIGKTHRFLAVVPLGFEQTFVNELECIRRETTNAEGERSRGCSHTHDRAQHLVYEPKANIQRRETRDDNQARRESQPTELGMTESKALEQPQIVGDGKVEFTAKITDAWKAVAYSRIANRMLMHIADFKAENFRELEKKASEIPWELFLDERGRFPVGAGNDKDDVRCYNSVNPENSCKPSLITIHVTCKHSRLYHSDAIEERLQKIISKTFSSLDPSTPVFHASAQDDKIAKPQSEATSPLKASETSDLIAHRSYPQHLYVTLIDDRCTIWLDLAGEELYKRGFERFVNDAPLKETIAAAMIFEALHMAKQQEGDTPQPRHLSSSVQQRNSFSSKKSLGPIDASHLQDDRNKNLQDDTALTTNHQPQTTLLDLMAGSGTFSLEAACIASNIIPGVSRDFALKHQPAFKEATWKHILDERRKTKDERLKTSRLQVERRGDEFTSDSHNENYCKNERFIKIITSDISPKAISIIKHNVECSPLASITPSPIKPQLRDFFSYTAKEIAETCGDTSPIIVLNPPYGKRLDFDAPKLYTKIGKKIADLACELKALNMPLIVAILAPKDDTRPGSKYTCTANLLRECPALAPNKKSTAKLIETSHGGFSLNAFIAKI